MSKNIFWELRLNAFKEKQLGLRAEFEKLDRPKTANFIRKDGKVLRGVTFVSHCPICEKQLAMRRSGEFSDEEIASLSPKRRTMYNVVVWDSKDEIRKGVQIFEISHFFFEKHLAELSKRPKGGGFVVFSDPDEGKTIVFKKKSKGKGNMEFLGHRFEEREDQITDEMLDAALCLDDLIHVPTVSELKKAVEDKDYNVVSIS